MNKYTCYTNEGFDKNWFVNFNNDIYVHIVELLVVLHWQWLLVVNISILDMENIKLFLESSTIHGLTFISSTKGQIRFFWIMVVIAGFTGAGIMINQSFNTWNESPVKTTIDTFRDKKG